eukprot:scaffold16092_cov127-Isochrysis_galbana.AAC.9
MSALKKGWTEIEIVAQHRAPRSPSVLALQAALLAAPPWRAARLYLYHVSYIARCISTSSYERPTDGPGPAPTDGAGVLSSVTGPRGAGDAIASDMRQSDKQRATKDL